MPASVRFELFPSDLKRSIDFYTTILGFTIRKGPEPDYAYVVRDGIRIGLAVKKLSEFPEGARDEDARAQYRLWPTGVEIVFEVDDLDAERKQILDREWTLHEDIKLQEWGLKDFRIQDPDGYYIRITTASSAAGTGI